MSKTEFNPKTFHKVVLIDGEINTAESLCTPGYPNRLCGSAFNKISLNCPEDVIYHIDSLDELPKSHKFVLPVCVYFIISMRRSLKYYKLKHTINIRKIGDDKWNSGVVEVIYNDSVPMPNAEERAKRLQKEREEAQKYSEEELNSGQGGGGARNFNLFDFINLPVTSGRYEIFYSAKGLESNHFFVEIRVEEKKKA